MKLSYKKALAAALAVVLGGCSTLTPMQFKEHDPTTAKKAAKQAAKFSGWDNLPVTQDGVSDVTLMVPAKLPAAVANQPITLSLDPGATVKDVVAILGNKGVPVILSDETAGKQSFYMPFFKGTVGELLNTISRTTDVWFLWNAGTLMVTSSARIGMTIPQEETFAKMLTKGLKAMGVSYSSVSWEAGLATVDVTPSEYRKVRLFLKQLTDNAVVVNMQVAVINVTLNQDANEGINWSNLSVAALTGGNLQQLAAAQQGVGSSLGNIGSLPTSSSTSGTYGTTGTTGTIGTTGGTTGGTTAGTTAGTSGASSSSSGSATTAAAGTVGALAFAGGALQGALFGSRFSFSGLFNYLETYGNANTSQNVLLRTVSGVKTEFKSLTEVPYVSQVGVTTTTTGLAGSSLGSSQTAKADDGITVKLEPTFDAHASTVTINFHLNIKAVLGFNNLSAGNQLGTLTQPTTADQAVNAVLRMRPGQTVVVGGLTYDSVSNNRGAPIALVGTNLDPQSLTVKRQTMFVVLRPTIVKFGKVVVEDASSDGFSIAGPVPASARVKGGSDVGTGGSDHSSTSSSGSTSNPSSTTSSGGASTSGNSSSASSSVAFPGESSATGTR